MKKINILDFNAESLFVKCRESFFECFRIDDNYFLEKELGGEIENIVLLEESVSFVYQKWMNGDFCIDIRINLLNLQKELIGHYVLRLDVEKNPLDDFLVFY